MSKLRLTGSTSGFTELTAPAVAGSNTLTLPTSNGSADQALVTNGSGTLSFADRGRMTLGTAVASTSGTSIDFTGIPGYVKRVTVMFSGVSTTGTSIVQLQLGAGSVTTTGYNSSGSTVVNGNAVSGITSTTGILTGATSGNVDVRYGTFTLALFSGNTWVGSGTLASGASYTQAGGGSITLSGTLDRIRITTVNGTDTFDAGSINIFYEG